MLDLHSETFDELHAELLYNWTRHDSNWYVEELGRQATKPDIVSYIQTYKGIGCKWKLWKRGDQPVAISCALPNAPSNHKPWVGTVVVNPEMRNLGIGRAVISKLREEIDEVMFAGIPYARIDWSIFLGKCGFEQYGIEEAQSKKYLIMVLPY